MKFVNVAGRVLYRELSGVIATKILRPLPTALRITLAGEQFSLIWSRDGILLQWNG